MLKEKDQSERVSYMRISDLKNEKGEEEVTLRIISEPQYKEGKGQRVIKLKVDDSKRPLNSFEQYLD